MAYMVTGGTGFIGARIVRDLLREGEQVVVYDLFPTDTFFKQVMTDEEIARVKIVRGDVTDLPYLIHSVQENHVDRIIHLASLLGLPARANPPLAVKINCDGTINVFETARICGLKKVVWASSVAVFGPQEKYPQEYIPNDAPHYPWGVYGACKSFNENMASCYFEQYNLDICALRYPIVYALGASSGITGPLIRGLIENPAVGKPGTVPFGDHIINWLYIDDAARATVLAVKAPPTKTRAFTVSGDIRSVKEAAECVKKLLPGANFTMLPSPTGVSCYRYDTKSIEEEIGFKFQWTLEEGFREVINTVRRQHGLPLV